VALEGVEVAQARGPQDRRPERDIARGQDRIVVVATAREPLDKLGERLDPEPSREVVVEGRDRLAV
jgi:hypothetical protein